MDLKDISISDFHYELPEHRIAHYPLTERDASRLLVYEQGEIREDIYRNLPAHLPPDSLLLFNNSRVIAARINFFKVSGARIEIFCLEPHEQYGSLPQAMARRGSVLWLCMIGGASKWKHGSVLEKKIRVGEKMVRLQAVYHERRIQDTVVELTWDDMEMSFAQLLEVAGAMPLPPYIKRDAERSDEERYQTIYAAEPGSVAAPTAGLHFTEEIFKGLRARQIRTAYLTLHVGAGTFKPVSSELMKDHDMHAELINVPRQTIQQIKDYLDKGITVVGTTTLRTVESLYWIGVQLKRKRVLEEAKQVEDILQLDQWEVYEYPAEEEPELILNYLLQWMDKQNRDSILARTRILIGPGYRPRLIRGLVTNFHQPGSTLLLLVAALIGPDWRSVYEYALQHDFRFLSYGDGCLIKL